MKPNHGVRGTQRDRFDDGFTLVELLVALFIITLTFTVLLSVLMASLGAIRSNEARVRATALSNEIIEEMVATPWSSLGLYVDEAPSATFEVDGEEEGVVLFPAEDPNDPAVPLAVEQIERDGRDYDVQRWITWVEDDDGDGDGQDLKRLVVIVTWQVDGNTRTMRTESLRSPLPTEVLDLTVSFQLVENGDIGSGVREFGLTDDDFRNDAQIKTVIVVGEAAAEVELSWRDRDGVLRTMPTPDTEQGETTRTIPIAAGHSTFPHGPVSLVVTAVGEDDQIASNTATVHFYQDLVVMTPVVSPSDEIVIDCDGFPVDDISVIVDVEGMTGSTAFADGVTLQWTSNFNAARPDPALGVTSVKREVWGGEFQFVIGQEEVAQAGVFQDGEVLTFTVSAEREAEYFSAGPLSEDSSPVEVVQVEGC